MPPLVQVTPPSERPWAPVDPIALYGDGIKFDVFRNGSNIGRHEVKFSRSEDGALVVENDSNIRVKVLFIVAFRMNYEARSVWRDGKLVELTAFTNNNGDERYVEGKWDGEMFRVDGPRGRKLATAPPIPSHHWNVGITQMNTVLNTLNGDLAEIEMIREGIETIDTAAGPVDAEKFEYTGGLRDTWVWYDADGRWVKMAFKGTDGSMIEYVCQSCGL